MSAHDRHAFTAPLPLDEGLLDWTRRQSPDMWHEIARRADFTAPGATIDLLLACHWIALQPFCDRATALLMLTRAVEGGLLGRACPPQFAPEAAQAFCRALHRALEAGCFLEERILLTPLDLRAIDANLGEGSPLALAPALRRTAGRRPHRPPFAFAGQRPVQHARALAA